MAALEPSRPRSSRANISMLRSRAARGRTQRLMFASITAIWTPFADATLLISQTSNPQSDAAPSNLMLATLMRQINQLTAVLATQKENRAANSRSLPAISDRLGRLERSRVDQGNHEFVKPHLSAPAAPQFSPVLAKTCRRRLQTMPKDAVLDPIIDPMQFCKMLPEPSDQSLDRNCGRTVRSRPFVLPLDRHDGAVARVLPPHHAAFASLPPPLIPHPLPSAPLMPLPLPLIASVSISYSSLATSLCRCRILCRQCRCLLLSHFRMPLLKLLKTLRIATRC